MTKASSSSTTPASQTHLTSSSSTSPPRRPSRSIPPLVLLSFAVIHSQLYWLYSVIYHLCQNLSDRPVDLSLDESMLNALTRRAGRARAFSEPQQMSTVVLQQRQVTGLLAPTALHGDHHHNHDQYGTAIKRRPRSTTISATTVDADAPLRRQQWVQHVHACLDERQRQEQRADIENDIVDRAAIMDERLGRTRPPRWWQRTRKHLTRQDKEDSDSNNSNFSLPANVGRISMESSLSLPAPQKTVMNPALIQTLTNLPVSPSPAPPSGDPERHHDITDNIDDSAMPVNISSSISQPSSSSASLASSLVSSASPPTLQSTSKTASPPLLPPSERKQVKQRRPLAKIRSVFIKSQIEPERSRSLVSPKRKTILGIPSRWSTATSATVTQQSMSPPPSSTTPPPSSSLSLSLSSTVALLPTPNPSPKEFSERLSVRIKEPNQATPPLSPLEPPVAPSPKKRLFSSLPAWKRKSLS